MQNLINQFDEIMSGTGETTPKKVADIVGEVVDENSNTEAEDEYGNKIIIPAGFKIVPHGTSHVEYNYAEGENKNKPTVQDGIVVEDWEGNQFVWIPVGKIKNKSGDTNNGAESTITLGRYEDFTVKTDEEGKKYYTPVQTAEQYKSEEANANDLTYQENYKISSSEYMELTKKLDGKNEIAGNLGDFLSRAKANGGYYLARYEASYRDGTKPYSKQSTGMSKESIGIAITEGMLWNYVTQAKASEASKAMYTGKESKYESDLVNSYAWDTAIIFIQTYSNNKNYASQGSKNDELENTGERTKTTTDKVCNIYDMASNTEEWSTEYDTYTNVSGNEYPCVLRGGLYTNSNCPTSYRYRSSVGYSIYDISFRPLLYCSPES